MKKNLKFLAAAFLLLPTIILLSGCKFTKVDISSAEMTLEYETHLYTGQEITPEVTVMHEEKELVLDEDYTVSYINNKNVGTATVTVKGISKFKGTKSASFEIDKADMTGISATPYEEVFDGENKTVRFVGLKDGDTVLYSLEIDGEFLPAHPEIKNVGEHTIYFKVQRTNHTEFVSNAKINILPATQALIWESITKAEDEDFFELKQAFDGEEVEFSFTGAAAGSEVFYSTDNKQTFTKDFPEIKDTGNYTVFVKITNSNYHTVEIEVRIEIYPLSGLNAIFSNLDQTYNGEEKTVLLEVLTEGSTIKYSTEDNGIYNLTELPKFIDAGVYNIYYQISKTNYQTAEGQITFTIKKAVPALYNTTASAITYGQKVGDSIISFDSSTEGAANWLDPEAVPNASDEAQLFFFTFTPNNPNYKSLSYSTPIKVNKATPSISFDYARHNLYKGSSTPRMWLLDENEVDGNIAFDEEVVVIGTNEYTWTFTPHSENYNIVTGVIELTVQDNEILEVWLYGHPDRWDYMAFEEFDPAGLELGFRIIDGTETREEFTFEYDKIVYQEADRNYLMAGDEYVFVMFAGFQVIIEGIYVEKIYPEINVEYIGPEFYTPNMVFDEEYFSINSSVAGTLEFHTSDFYEDANYINYTFTPEDTDNYETIHGYIEFYLEREESITEFKINGEIFEIDRYDEKYYYLENYDDLEIIVSFDSSRFNVSIEYSINHNYTTLDIESNVAYMITSSTRYLTIIAEMIGEESEDYYSIALIRAKTIKSLYFENEEGETFRAYTERDDNQEIIGFYYNYNDAPIITNFLYEMDESYNVVVMKNGEIFEISKLEIGQNNLTLAVYNQLGELVEEVSLNLEYIPIVIFENINISFDEEDNKRGYSTPSYGEEINLLMILNLEKEEQGRIFSGREDLILTVYDDNYVLIEEPFTLSFPLKPIKLNVHAVYKETYEFDIVIYISQESNDYFGYLFRSPYTELGGKSYEFHRNTGSVYFNSYGDKIPITYSNQEVYDNLQIVLFGDIYQDGITIKKSFEAETGRIFLNVYEYEELVRIAEIVVSKYGTIDDSTSVMYDHYSMFESLENVLESGIINASVGDQITFYTENEVAQLEISYESEMGIESGYEENSVMFSLAGEYEITIKVTASDGVTEKTYTVTIVVEEMEPFAVIELLNGETYTLKLDIIGMSFGDFYMIDSDNTIVYVYAALDIDQMNLYMQDGEFFAKFLSINQMGSVVIGSEEFTNPRDAKLELVVYNDLMFYQFIYQFEVDGETLYIVTLFTFTELEEVVKIGFSYNDEQGNLITAEEVLSFDRLNKTLIGNAVPYYMGGEEEPLAVYSLDLSRKLELDENNQATLTLTTFEGSSIILFDMEELMPTDFLGNEETKEVTLLFTDNVLGNATLIYLCMFPIEGLEDLVGEEPPEGYDPSLMIMLIILA